MSLRLLLLLTPFLASCQGESPPEGGVEELVYDGGALDGSEDGELPDLALERGLAAAEQGAAAGGQRDAERQAELEALAAAYEPHGGEEVVDGHGLVLVQSL